MRSERLAAVAAYVCACVVAGCSRSVLVAAPSGAGTRVDGATERAEDRGIVVRARLAAPRERGATPVQLLVENRSRVAVRVSPDDFGLVAGQEVTGARRFGPEARDRTASALEERGLRPGETLSGTVSFESPVGDWKILVLRTTLVDAVSGATYATIDLPFEQVQPPPCHAAAALPDGLAALLPRCAPL